MSSREVFVDTWAWVALSVDDDPGHAEAVRHAQHLRAGGALWVTSNFVLAESLTRLRYDAGLAIALQLLAVIDRLISTGRLEVVIIDHPLWQSAAVWFRHYQDQRFSFVDCTSFAVMRTRGIQDAVTVDRHFAAAGFTPLAAA